MHDFIVLCYCIEKIWNKIRSPQILDIHVSLVNMAQIDEKFVLKVVTGTNVILHKALAVARLVFSRGTSDTTYTSAVIVNEIALVTVDIVGGECAAITIGAVKNCVVLFYEPSASEVTLWMMRVDENIKCLLVTTCIYTSLFLNLIILGSHSRHKVEMLIIII